MSAPPELAPAMCRHEDARQATLMKRKTGLAWIAALAVPAALWSWMEGSTLGLVLSVAAGAGAAWWYARRLRESVKDAFKDDIVPILLRTIDPALHYTRRASIPEADFDAADLFASADRYAGQDLVQGTVGATAVRFSLVHAEERYEETTTDSDGKSHTETHYRTLFKGVFLIADFNKDFPGRTWVRPGAAGFFGRMSAAHVALEDPHFNKLFTVQSTDQVEARYILTPALMDRLRALRSRIGPFRAAFARGSLYMAFDMAFDAFDPLMNQSLADPRQSERILVNLRSVTRIVDDLALDVRIWTKTPSPRPAVGEPA